MVLLGFWARLGALALLTFTVIATLLAHGSRGLTGEKRQQQETSEAGRLARCKSRLENISPARKAPASSSL